MRIYRFLQSFVVLLVIVSLVFGGFPYGARAVTEGPQPPTTSGNDTGVGTEAWVGTSNALSSNDVRTTAPLAKSEISNYLTVTGFDFSAIPDGSVILGITVEIERSEAGLNAKGGIVDSEVRIIQDGTIDTT